MKTQIKIFLALVLGLSVSSVSAFDYVGSNISIGSDPSNPLHIKAGVVFSTATGSFLFSTYNNNGNYNIVIYGTGTTDLNIFNGTNGENLTCSPMNDIARIDPQRFGLSNNILSVRACNNGVRFLFNIDNRKWAWFPTQTGLLANNAFMLGDRATTYNETTGNLERYTLDEDTMTWSSPETIPAPYGFYDNDGVFHESTFSKPSAFPILYKFTGNGEDIPDAYGWMWLGIDNQMYFMDSHLLRIIAVGSSPDYTSRFSGTFPYGLSGQAGIVSTFTGGDDTADNYRFIPSGIQVTAQGVQKIAFVVPSIPNQHGIRIHSIASFINPVLYLRSYTGSIWSWDLNCRTMGYTSCKSTWPSTKACANESGDLSPGGEMCETPISVPSDTYASYGGTGGSSVGTVHSIPSTSGGSGDHIYTAPTFSITGASVEDISLKNAFAGCPSGLSGVDVGYFSFLSDAWFEFTVPYIGYQISFHPFGALVCPIKAVVNLYNRFYSLAF